MIKPNEILALCDFETTGIREWSDPIEVAILFVNHELQVVASVDTLIKPDDFLDDYDESELPAYAVHKITPSMLRRAPSRKSVAKLIQRKTKEALKLAGADRCVLTSDNIDFESRMMRVTLNTCDPSDKDWPFHYNGNSTRMLTKATGVEPRKKQHRAMADVGALLEELREARSKLPKSVTVRTHDVIGHVIGM